MATTTVHAQLIKYASNGDQTILYLENSGADVTVSRASNSKIPTSVTTVQKLVDALGSLAFSDGITVSGLTTSNFADGVITQDLTVSVAGKIADARALKTLNDKIATNESNISKLNSNYSELSTDVAALGSKVISATLTASGWSGTKAPYSQGISVGTEYTDPTVFEIVQSPSCTDTQNVAFFNMVGGPCTLSNGTLTLKIYGKKPTEDIPVIIIIRGEI